MSKGIKKEELKNVSGGTSEHSIPKFEYICPNKKCQKTFLIQDSIYKDGKIYCPYCGTFVADEPR